GARELQVLADEMDQQRARLDEAFDFRAVHFHLHVGLCHSCLPQAVRPAARCSARTTITPPTCLRYSTGPRASAAGDMIACAAVAAFFSVTSSSDAPLTDCAASFASRGFSDRVVRPMAQETTLPPAMVRTTAAAAVA